jgi:glycosyltransferase involved in cell wall biosynthesis
VPSLPAGRGAIVHDWFQGFHGSERVVDAIWRDVFPPDNRPDILTFQAARELLPRDLADAIVRESRLALLPGVRQRGHDPGRWRYLLPYMPHYFRGLDLGAYDVVVASSHACAVQVRPRAGAAYVCYCHTPMRYAWLPESEEGRVGGVPGIALRAFAGRLRRLDLEASRRPDVYVANSSAVRERIRRFYDRDATVMHPPVDVDDFRADSPKESGSFLWVNRLISYKRPDVVVEAFRRLPDLRLTMVGVGPLDSRLRAALPRNVDLRGWLPREELVPLYESASGFVHVGEEDFGIGMVEALAAGSPVVALARGGAADIVRPDLDGILVEQADPDVVAEAIEAAAERRWDAPALAARAREFSRARFVEGFRAVLQGM